MYIRNKLYVPNFNYAFNISIKSIAEENILPAAMLLTYILQEYYLNRSCIFFPQLLIRIIPLPGIYQSVSRLPPASKLRMSGLLVFLTTEH